MSLRENTARLKQHAMMLYSNIEAIDRVNLCNSLTIITEAVHNIVLDIDIKDFGAFHHRGARQDAASQLATACTALEKLKAKLESI